MIAWNEFEDKEPSLFGISSYQHLKILQTWVMPLVMKLLGMWFCSNLYKWVSRYPNFFCRYHKELRYQALLKHHYAISNFEFPTLNYMVQLWLLKFVEMELLWNSFWSFSRNLLKAFMPKVMIVLNLFHPQLSGRSWILEDLCIGQPIFLFCQGKDLIYLYQPCISPCRSYLQHPPCLISNIQGGTFACMSLS